MKHLITAAALVATVGCKSQPTSPPQTGTAPTMDGPLTGSASAPPSGWDNTANHAGANEPAKPAPPPKPPEDPKVIAERALQRIPKIKAGVAALRGAPFKFDVPATYQTNADFRSFLTTEISRELPPAKSKNIVEAYVALGLLTERIDLGQAMADTMASQAAAYYDPNQKKFFMVMAPNNDLALDTISAHELTHAHQDQYFDLNKFLAPNGAKGKPLSDDQANARKFLVEGEATFAMFAYILAEQSKKPFDKSMMGMLNMQLKLSANLTPTQLRDMAKAQAESMGPEMAASAAAMEKIPPIILVPMIDSYMKGAIPVAVAWEKGGWKAVGDLYRTPPHSTEQMLHPDTKLYPRDLPQVATLPTQKGLTLVEANVIGEVGWRVYFDLWGISGANDVAAGWDGDQFAVWRRTDGSLLTLLATTWDSEADAIEFETNYAASLTARLAPAKASLRQATANAFKVVRAGASVFVVDGAVSQAEADKLAATLTKVTFAEVKP